MNAQRVGRLADRPLDAGGLRIGPIGTGERALDRPPQAGQRQDRVTGAIERRPDQLGHARIEHDLATSAVANVQHPRDQPAGAGHQVAARLDRQAGRATIGGSRFEEIGQLSRKPGRIRCRCAQLEDREAAADVERVERLDRSPPQRSHRQGSTDGVAPGVDRCQL